MQVQPTLARRTEVVQLVFSGAESGSDSCLGTGRSDVASAPHHRLSAISQNPAKSGLPL